MNGISLVISKSCCPMYNYGTSNKINLGTGKKMDLIPCKLLNLHHQRCFPLIATKSMLKHRVSSSFSGNYLTVSRFEEPEASTAVVQNVLLGVVIGCLVLVKAGREAKVFLGDILFGLQVLHDKPFSPGDIIEVGYLKGEVMRMGVTTTSLRLTENRCIVELPTSWFYGQVIMNKSRATAKVPYSLIFGQVNVNQPWREMESKIYLNKDDFVKMPMIKEDIENMLRLNSNVYLEEMEPYCVLSGLDDRYCVLTLGCYLKQMSDDETYSAKQDVLLQSAKIIAKHGAALGGYKRYVNSL